jgi:hypothetical protein
VAELGERCGWVCGGGYRLVCRLCLDELMVGRMTNSAT